ncbi:Gfo/Idh/MocA family oxidoreductase [Halalkalibacter sp. APA_J-10(15)]|nr:Gfo/Idh/MocA family oxidoreductase [Halalkalibacter sp. APA_J-10(15)]MCK0470302.1 hypothetical protein [Halalkalibacter sp. APA_J-10(15)]
MAQLTHFLRACQGEEELVVKPEQAAQVTQIIDAIYRSSEIGKSVEL